MKKRFLIHPFLFGLSPILSLFLHNINEASFSIILVPSAIVLCLTIVLLSLAIVIFKDCLIAGIVVSFFLLLFFSYVSLSEVVMHSIKNPAFRYLVSVGSCMLLIFIVYIVTKRHNLLVDITKVFNFVSIFLFLFLLVNIGVYKLKTVATVLDIKSTEISKIDASTIYSEAIDKLPDIYYIILDRYANKSTLKEIYDFDNTEFVNYLSNKGFYVASQSKSNYLKTIHSLSSSLNMKYINDIEEKIKGPPDNYLPIQAMLKDYKVWRFLKSKGYQFIHFGSWWPPTCRNNFADMNINLYWPPDFINVLYRRTILYPILKKLGYPHNLVQWKRIIYKFDKLCKIPNIKEPTFVFAHMLITHPPYVFDRYGNFLSEDMVAQKSIKETYIEQLIFTNEKVKDLIDKLISNSEDPPIIILQADEGPFPRRYRLNTLNFNWNQASKAELSQKMGILNAYYLPHIDKNVLYPSITPVNSFRLIFNQYFNTHFELLPDKCYAFVDERHPYTFFDVTDSVSFESPDTPKNLAENGKIKHTSYQPGL